MTPRVARLAPAVVLFVVVACGGCAERAPSRPDAASEAPVAATPAPPPAPTPVPVPRELACEASGACTLSPYPRSVSALADCYCPACPQPLSLDAAGLHEAQWGRICGPGWAERARCRAPMCPRPPAVACREGACAFATTP